MLIREWLCPVKLYFKNTTNSGDRFGPWLVVCSFLFKTILHLPVSLNSPSCLLADLLPSHWPLLCPSICHSCLRPLHFIIPLPASSLLNTFTLWTLILTGLSLKVISIEKSSLTLLSFYYITLFHFIQRTQMLLFIHFIVSFSFCSCSTVTWFPLWLETPIKFILSKDCRMITKSLKLPMLLYFPSTLNYFN